VLPALQQQGIEALVGVLRPPHDLRDELAQRRIRVVPVHKSARWNILAARNCLSEICRHNDIHLVNSHLYFSSISIAVLGCSSSIPVVETFGSSGISGIPKGVTSRAA
jgi:hypothetical protein